MTTKINEVPQHLQKPFRTAVRRWKENESPDDFTTDVIIETENGTQELTVSVYHHETFPLGSQLFTVDIRSQDPYPDNLLHRERIEHDRWMDSEYDDDDEEDDEEQEEEEDE